MVGIGFKRMQGLILKRIGIYSAQLIADIGEYVQNWGLFDSSIQKRIISSNNGSIKSIDNEKFSFIMEVGAISMLK